MRVLQINSVCGIGSTGRIAADIHSILADQGHERYIAYGRDTPKGCGNAIRIGRSLDFYSHVVKTRLLDRQGFGSRSATRRFLERVETIDPDIIHLHNIHGYYFNIEVFFRYLASSGKTVIWTLHDCWPFTGHCAYFDYVGCEKWKVGCHDCPEKGSYPASIWIDNSRDNYTQKRNLVSQVRNLWLVTPSKWLANLVQESFLSQYPVTVINNGVDLNVFKPTSSQLRRTLDIEDKFVILGVAGVWDRRKGLEHFLEMAKSLDRDEAILLVGLSERQMRDLPNGVIGISRTRDVSELAELYSLADVFVNPTMEDNFPTTNLESLACGTPVITFSSGGSVECIDLTCGLSVQKGDIDALRAGINEVKSKGKSWYFRSCVDRATRKYRNVERYQEYVDMYANLVLGMSI